MTIGSSYEYPAHRATALQRALAQPALATNWSVPFPNPPDLCFDYRKLVEGGAVATPKDKKLKIGIIGAGMTGLTAARELFRCGFDEVTLFESSDRIAGRHKTITNVAGQGLKTDYTPFEMAAMRMPFFSGAHEEPKEGRSLLAFYAQQFCLSHEDFPNPGTSVVNSTGIYLQEGTLGSSTPTLQIWDNTNGSTPPPLKELKEVQDKWNVFFKVMVDVVSTHFGGEKWESIWNAMVDRYSGMAFRDMVRLAAIPQWDPKNPGDFGGFGLTAEQSDIFYSIGFGDGSWGAFYDVCAIYPIRTSIFGFASRLQLIHGRYDSGGGFNPGPLADKPTVPDTAGNQFDGPKYRGVRSFDDCMLFLPVPERDNKSFYDHCIERQAGLMTSSEVVGIEHLANGQNRVKYTNKRTQQSATMDFDALIITVPSWIMEVKMEITGFSPQMIPPAVTRAYKTAHWETSCKVYAPLKPEFFSDFKEKKHGIPQILVTDSFIHDVYAYEYKIGGYANPCILMSYTWEDDATKLSSFTDAELVDKVVTELDRILTRSTNVGKPISPYILKEHAQIERWMSDEYALGCAKLYRAGAYGDAMRLLAYNRDHSAKSGLYMAGESFSVDAGWTEPCFRGAVDAVINICNNTGARFNNPDFKMGLYPTFYVPA